MASPTRILGSPKPAAPSVTLPSGGGSLRTIDEKVGTAPATGTATASIPIATSAGRGELRPDLSLAYDGGAGNGPFGLGWQLGVPSISRRVDRGVPRYGDAAETDRYMMSGAELVPELAADGSRRVREDGGFRIERYRPRSEGAFVAIERWVRSGDGDVHWRTISRTNTITILGRSPEARIADPDDRRRVFSWLAEEQRDGLGNVVAFTWRADDERGVDLRRPSERTRAGRERADRLLKRISYGNREPDVAGEWLVEVVFDYGDHDPGAPTPEPDRPWPLRPDPFVTCRPGFELRHQRLCRRILVFHHLPELGEAPCLVQSTDLTYHEDPVATQLASATHSGYLRGEDGAYERESLPPLRFGYTAAVVDGTVRTVGEAEPDPLPAGVSGGAQLIDLDGEGLSGVLNEEGRWWRYRRNLGEGRFGPSERLATLPAGARLGDGAQRLLDVTDDGRPDLVTLGGGAPGYAARAEEGWEPFRPFPSFPSSGLTEGVHLVDLTGDGRADLLVDAGGGLRWHPSLGSEGYGEAVPLSRPVTDDGSPVALRPVADQAVLFADMNGDGLPDLVRVGNGEVTYWPSLGYGRFGPPVVLDRPADTDEPPAFEEPGLFDPGRVRLADTDGSGTADVVYLDARGATLHRNQAGNGLGLPHRIDFPEPVGPATVEIADVTGSGTASLIWSSPLPAGDPELMRCVDLAGGVKPYLLRSVDNSMGRRSEYTHAPSTKFFLADRERGRPWATRLPFPVHVLERVETIDEVAGTRLVTRFAYHHGRYDPVEREFSGFGCVEQWDAESFSGGETEAPPVRTVTWFHTGFGRDVATLSDRFAEEYYAGDPLAPRLPDTELPPGLTTAEERDAVRALRGQMLRQETYGEDGTEASPHPYLVSERAHGVRLVQPRTESHHAVIHVHQRQSLDFHYERNPDDPRVSHQLTLAVDDLGNVTRGLDLAYPRRPRGGGATTHPEQEVAHGTLTEYDYAHLLDAPGVHRVGLPIEARAFELLGLPAGAAPLSYSAARALVDTAVPLAAEAEPVAGAVALRPLERVRTLYAAEDGAATLPLGTVTPRALLSQELALAFTDAQLTVALGERTGEVDLAAEGGYVREGDAWWLPSGRRLYDPERFCLQVAYEDPFGERQEIEYEHDLLTRRIEDPVGNAVTVVNDLRLLRPVARTDPNGNRTEVATDTLGRVVAVAEGGKGDEADPARRGGTLAHPTQRYSYRTREWIDHGRPVAVDVASRETYGEESWQEATTYYDGSGREVQRKSQAEPGEAPLREPGGELRRTAGGDPVPGPVAERWSANGRRVYDGKGNLVKEYLPFFSATRAFEDEADLVEIGKSPLMRYDPIGRLTRTDLPDGTLSRVEISPWEQVDWDESDSVAGTAWLAARATLPPSDPQRRAADQATAHSGTPERSHLDPRGRPFLSQVDNGAHGIIEHRFSLDAKGNPVRVLDGRGNVAMEALYGMLSQRLWLSRGAAGERRVLVNAADHPLREWDSRGQRHRHSYDELQRPTHLFVRTADGVESLAERVFYGEGADDAAARNLRQQVHVVFDSAGRRELVAADFRGLPLRISRGLAGAYRADPDWSALADAPDLAAADRLAAPLLGPDRFDATTEYDALSRPVVSALPDGSRREPRYNAAGLLEGIGVRLRGAAETTSFLTDLEYDAKGQRTAETYGNGVRCAYSYDPDTLRLAGMRAERAGEVLQDLSYAYDPVGNVVGVRDAAQQTRFFDNAVVGADLEYEHDAAYRLVLARGRERVAGQPGPRGDPPFPLPHPNDGTAVQRYVERYEHDLAGNLVRVEHRGGDGGWTRAYDYAADSDRLRGSSLPGDAPGTFSARYEHDAHGSVTAMPHLPALSWSHADRLREVDLGAGERAFYVYDAKGERVRKVIERNGARKEERVYCGEFETYRRFVADAVRFERETLHVGQGGHRVALVETETVVDGRREETPRSRRRFQTCDHLSSVSVETDEAGAVISYEQYLPFGAGAYRSARADLEASPKRYGYVGRELDVETGFGHHGARQYAPWLGRFVSFDPLETTGAGKSGDANGYAYAHNNPVVLSDPNGMISWGQAIGFGVAVAVGVAVTVFTGGIAGPIVAGVLGGMAAGFAGEVVEQLVDHGRVKDWKAVGISTAVGGLLGGLFAGAGAAIAKGLSSAAGRAVVAKAANHTIGQTVLKAAYAVSRSIVGRSARAAGKAIRSASTPVQEAGEATGRSMGGWFATNAARQQAAREGAEQAVAAASQPTGKGVRAAIVGEADGAPLNASTHSGQHRPNKQTVDGRRTIVTPEGEVPPPSTPPPPPLQAHEVAPANGGKPYLRDHDAEFKLFGHVINTTQPGASGNLYISAGQPMCPSCTANAWNFRVGRPNLNLSVGAPDVPTAGGAGALVPPLVQPGREGDPPPTVPVLQFNF